MSFGRPSLISLDHDADLSSRHRSTEKRNSILTEYNRIFIDGKFEEKVPEYLLHADRIFEQMLQTLNSTSPTTSSITIELLREIAILTHHFIVVRLVDSIWFTYFQCCTGISKTFDADAPKFWPEKLIRMVRAGENMEEVTNEYCLTIVRKRIGQVSDQISRYKEQLKEKTKSLNNYDQLIEPMIRRLIDERVQLLQVKIDHDNALIRCDYEDHRLQLALPKQQLSLDQMSQIQSLCQRKDEEEKSKHEVLLLKAYSQHNKFPPTLQSLTIRLPDNMALIQNEEIRQQLCEQHEHILQQYKNKMIHFFLRMAETYEIETCQLYAKETAQFWQVQRTLPVPQRLNINDLKLIQQRLTNIKERIQTIYQYQIHHLSD